MGSHAVTHLTVLASSFAVETRSRAAERQLADQWARCRSATAPGTATRLLAADSPQPLSRELLHRLVFTLTDRAIENLAGRAVVLHAAGLATADGSVIALVAPSGTGKTTAAVTLCRNDFGYVTDETVAVFPDLTVPPFPKPLALLDPAAPDDPDAKVHRSPDELGLRPCPADLRLGRVVLLDRSAPPGSTPRVTPVPLDEAVVALLEQTSMALSLPHPLSSIADLLAQTGGAWRLTYDEIAEAATALADLAADPPQPVEDWQPPALPQPDAAGGVGQVRLAPLRDAIEVGDRIVMLVDATPVRLGPLAATIVRAARNGATEDRLLDACVTEHGDHPDAVRIVDEAIVGLVAAGVLVRDG